MMINIQTTKKLYYLGFSIILLDLSLMYINQAGHLGLNITMLPQFFVSAIFGFVHGNRKYTVIKQISEKNTVLESSLLDILYPAILYTAWYNVILLPVSGLGILEWIFVATLLLSDFICGMSRKESKRILYLSEDSNLIYLGVLLAILKQVIFYLFPENIYVESFAGNNFARFLVLGFSIIGLIFLIKTLIKTVKIDVKASSKKIRFFKNGFVKGIKKLAKQLKMYGQAILNLFSGPAVIIVIMSVIGVCIIFILIFVKTLAEDILRFVENYLLKILSTGKATIVPSVVYYIFQIIVVFGVLIFDRVVFVQNRKNWEKLF